MSKKSTAVNVLVSPAEQLMTIIDETKAAEAAGKEAWREGESALVTKAEYAAKLLEETLRACNQDPLGITGLLERRPFHAPHLGRGNSSFTRLDSALEKYAGYSKIAHYLRSVRRYIAEIDYQRNEVLRLGSKRAGMNALRKLVDGWCETAARSKEEILKPIRHCLSDVAQHLERTKS